nr:hypothetical protein [uncultured Cellulosilyticum sp.]
MDNKYIIYLGDDNTILSVANTFDYTDDDIKLSEEEYKLAIKYRKFDAKTREFLEPIEEITKTATHEEITEEMHNITQISAEDNLLNMDLLTTIDEKLTLIMAHLGLSG